MRGHSLTVRSKTSLSLSFENLQRLILILHSTPPPPKAPSRTQFNPAAPCFTPSSSFRYSPNPPPTVPPNSLFSNASNTTSQYASPLVPQARNTSPRSFHSTSTSQYPPPPQPPHTTPQSFTSASAAPSGEEISNTSSRSGGIRVAQRTLIKFGDFPEQIAILDAGERRSMEYLSYINDDAEQQPPAAATVGLGIS